MRLKIRKEEGLKSIFTHPVYVGLEGSTRKENDASFLSLHLLGKWKKYH